ncbi:HamA C-terminal domain-containing protein [Pectobacterium carotovorum]
MDDSIKIRINNQIFKYEVRLPACGINDNTFTLDFCDGKYRQDDLVGLIRDVVPYFSLTTEELKELEQSEINKRSFTRISDARRQAKGDYGELMLFLILSIFYDVPKFVTKARLRSTTREQIKGFDCAHFSVENDKVTLWLGEAKFHQSISSAISSALTSLTEHLNDKSRISSELKLLGGEIEINKKLDRQLYLLLKSYVDGGKSLDEVEIAVPVLLTYDSKYLSQCCGKGKVSINNDSFRYELGLELTSHFNEIYKKNWPNESNIKIVFFLFPFENVADLKEKIELVEQAMKF